MSCSGGVNSSYDEVQNEIAFVCGQNNKVCLFSAGFGLLEVPKIAFVCGKNKKVCLFSARFGLTETPKSACACGQDTNYVCLVEVSTDGRCMSVGTSSNVLNLIRNKYCTMQCR